MLYEHTNEHGTFGLQEFDGSRRWIVVSGRCPGLLGPNHQNLAVPLGYAGELTDEAKAAGMDSSLLRAPESKKAVSGRSKGSDDGVKVSRSGKLSIKVFL